MNEFVALLHGLGRSRFSMTLMASRLMKEGYRTINLGYPSIRKSVDDHVERLRTVLLAELPDDDYRLNFVTHSLGSIVVRKFSLEYSEQFSLGRVVMLGPPNQGSELARKLAKSSVISKLMGPGFREVKELDLLPATDKLEVGIIAGGSADSRGYSPLLSGDNDGIVAVEETRLEGARDFIVVRGLHTTLMMSPRVIDHTVHFLRNGEFRKKEGPA